MRKLRLAVYADYPYHRSGETLLAEREFALFVDELGSQLEVVLVGRLDSSRKSARYEVVRQTGFVALPFYSSLGQPLRAAGRMASALSRFWRALDGVDGVWLLGPHPLSIAFAALAAIRRRRVAIGVRQDYVKYVRARYPRRPAMWAAAAMLESAYRVIAWFSPTVVVGPTLARRYRHARRLLQAVISLVREDEVLDTASALRSSPTGDLTLLSVGRLDREKNPLLLADVLALLRRDDPRWRLIVCGGGPLENELRDYLAERGLADHSELRGHVPFGPALREAYRRSDVFLHVSWTEGGGPPQVLSEAFAAGLPVVATDVGGVAAASSSVRLVPPGDAPAAALEIRRIATDPRTRRRLVESGSRFVRAHTLEAEAARVARFLSR